MPTMVDSYRTHVPLDGEVCLVEVMDTAGDELFLSLTEDQLRRGGGGGGFLCVLGLNDLESEPQTLSRKSTS